MIEKLGGNENISQATNCMTRLRVDVKNVNLVKVEELKALEGVLGLMVADNHYQVILGPGKVQNSRYLFWRTGSSKTYCKLGRK